MKSKPITRRRGQVNTHAPIDINDFEQLAGNCENIEHVTVPGFLRRIPHPWHIDDITRYGDKVGRVAEAMQLSYLTTVQPKLGMIRVFPLSLLQRVYQLMAPQHNWPQIIDETTMLEDGRRAQREELRRHESAKTHLQTAAEHAPSPAVSAALTVVLDWLESETQRLRVDAPPGTPPLRSI